MTVFIAAIIILLVIALSITLTYRIAVEPMKNQIANLQTTVNSIKTVQGVKGDTPILGKDYTVQDGKTPPCYYEKEQCRGTDGKDSVSTKTNTTTIEKTIVEVESQTPGIEWQVNRFTGNFETKLRTDTLWQILIPCTMFVNGCTAVNPPTPPIIPLPGLEEL